MHVRPACDARRGATGRRSRYSLAEVARSAASSARARVFRRATSWNGGSSTMSTSPEMQRRQARRVGADGDASRPRRRCRCRVLASPTSCGYCLEHRADVGLVAVEQVRRRCRWRCAPRRFPACALKSCARSTRCACDHALLIIAHELTSFCGSTASGASRSMSTVSSIDLRTRRARPCNWKPALRRRRHRALDREHDIVGGERRAVVEDDARAQLEAPRAVGSTRLPRRWRAPAPAWKLLVAADQRFVDLVDDSRRGRAEPARADPSSADRRRWRCGRSRLAPSHPTGKRRALREARGRGPGGRRTWGGRRIWRWRRTWGGRRTWRGRRTRGGRLPSCPPIRGGKAAPDLLLDFAPSATPCPSPGRRRSF